MKLLSLVAAVVVVGGCLFQYGDPSPETWIENRDPTPYVVVFAPSNEGRRVAFDVPANARGVALASLEFYGWTGRASLLERNSCRELASIAIGAEGEHLVVAQGSLATEARRPVPDADLKEVSACGVASGDNP